MNKLKILKMSTLLFVILSFSFNQNLIKRLPLIKPFIPNAQQSLQIGAQVGNVFTYNTTIGNETLFQKYQLTSLEDNTTHLKLLFDVFETSNLLEFNETATNQTQQYLSGKILDDLFSNASFFSIILPLSSNFSRDQAEFESLFTEFEEIPEISSQYEIDSSGLSFHISFYYRFIIKILVMSLDVYYSSNRILLKYHMWMRNPSGKEQANLDCNIVPEYSTADTVSENPYDPLNLNGLSNNISTEENSTISNTASTSSYSNSDNSHPASFIFDWQAVAIIGGVVCGIGISGIGIQKTIKFLRNRKR